MSQKNREPRNKLMQTCPTEIWPKDKNNSGERIIFPANGAGAFRHPEAKKKKKKTEKTHTHKF